MNQPLKNCLTWKTTGDELSVNFDRIEQRKLVEATLFMAPKTVSFEYLRSNSGLSTHAEVLSLLKELKEEYDSKQTVLEVYFNEESKEALMRVCLPYLDKVKHLASESGFNKGVQKTLALIAYRQPVKQSEIIKYRNNKAYDHIKELDEKGFIAREHKGRSYILRTTKKFLDYFGYFYEEKKKEIQQKAKEAIAHAGKPDDV